MATQLSEEQGILNQGEPIADVCVSVGLDPSQSGGSPEISENIVDEPYHRPLLQAVFRGDWESAQRFFEQDDASKTAKITSRSETVLHIAALSARDQFLENLVELLSPHPEALEMVDCDGRTALHNAVLCGRIRMVKALVWENPKLTQLEDNNGRVPLEISALEGSMYKEIVWFLVKNATADQPFDSRFKIDTIINLTYAGHHVLQRITRSLRNAPLILVPKRIYDMKLRHVTAIELAIVYCSAIYGGTKSELTKHFEDRGLLAEATVRGISELVKLVFQFFPELVWISPDGMKLMTYVVKYRQERTVGLFLKVSSNNESSLVLVPTIEESNRMMLAAVEYKPEFHAVTNVAGAAFQIQRELQWYKAVESWTIPSVRTTKHGERTYWNMFVERHKELLEKGEKWVKDTANSCMLVSTLIATVLFAAAFTVPGGNDGKTGVPLMLGHDSLVVFAISDALGLFSSIAAILLFLAILTSRYEPQDFLLSLPRKIIVGLSFLFLSVAFMLVAFATTLTIVLDRRVEWVLIPIILLASLLVALFARLQLPLLYQMVKSTYGPSIFRPKGIWDGVKYT